MVEASCQLLHWGHHRPLLHHSWFLLQAIRCPREHQSVALNSSFSTHYTPNLIAIQITAASFSQQHPHSWLDSIPAQEKYARNFRFLEAKEIKDKGAGGFIRAGHYLPAYDVPPTVPTLLALDTWILNPDPIPGAFTRARVPACGWAPSLVRLA